MKKSIASIFNMLVIVEDYLIQNQTIVLTIEGLAVMLIILTQRVAKMKQLHQKIATQSTKPAAKKIKIELALDKLLLSNSKKHVAYAVLTDNLELEKKVGITRSELLHIGNQKKLAFARSLYEINNINLPQLAVHGINVSTQSAFLVVVDEFEKEIPRVRENTTLGANDLYDFEVLIKETQDIVSAKIDKIVDSADEVNAAFISTYFRNRNLIDPPTLTLSLKGTVNSKESGLPLKDVKISIEGNSFKSTSKGNFRLAKKTAGVYTITYQKPGFVSQQREIVIGEAGETTILHVLLEKA